MSRPVTEVVTLPLHPEANAEGAIRALKAVLSKQDGFRSMKWGRWVQDKDKVQLIISWDDLSYHKKFEQSDADFATYRAALRPVLTGPPTMYHVYLDPAAVERILKTPVVEVATFYSVPADYSQEAGEFLDLLGSFKGGLGFLHADIVEDISMDGSNVKGRGYFALLAWASIALHVEAKESDAVQNNIHLIKGARKTNDIEWHYVSIM
ncbi:hypothetical protein BJY01DRAFT_247116 [Aspergillus pseudoustus]|uniref:ABM domain-containing protein n=1 Tax=Aspergillus pseudoustus TaxID=1810923 RepID=A0ABR4K2X8_9EURO